MGGTAPAGPAFVVSALPDGWAIASLGQLGLWSGGGTPSKADESLWRAGTIPWVSPKDMKSTVIETAQDCLSEAARGRPGFKLAQAGSVLIVVRSGILQHTLPVAVTTREVAFNQDLKALAPFPGLNARYLGLQLRAEAASILAACVKAGTTVESLDFARLKAFKIRIAPEAEQTRIVAKLEPLLARCEHVRAELDRVDSLIARQRRAIQTAVFHGRSGAEAGLSADVSSGWRTRPLSDLIIDGPTNGVSPRASAGDRGTLSLRLTATTSGHLRLDEPAVKRVNVALPPSSRFWLEPGDLLIQRANSREHVGAAAIFDGPRATYIYPDLMMRIRIEDPAMRRYVWRYLNSPKARDYFQTHAAGTAGNMPKITGRVLRELPVPIPPNSQLAAVLATLDARLSRLEAVAAENARCRGLVAKLERAFLQKAFTGRLVARQPGDKPAIRLLERFEAEGPLQRGNRDVKQAKPKSSTQTVQGYLRHQMTIWPVEGMTFEQLRSEAPGAYEELKDLIFELMESGDLTQRYDGREQKMKLVRPA